MSCIEIIEQQMEELKINDSFPTQPIIDWLKEHSLDKNFEEHICKDEKHIVDAIYYTAERIWEEIFEKKSCYLPDYQVYEYIRFYYMSDIKKIMDSIQMKIDRSNPFFIQNFVAYTEKMELPVLNLLKAKYNMEQKKQTEPTKLQRKVEFTATAETGKYEQISFF